MIALSDLVTVFSQVFRRPESTLFAYARFAREAGHIGQTGRAKKTEMTVRDVSNLLIAFLGTDVVKDAGLAITKYRQLVWSDYYPYKGNIAEAREILRGYGSSDWNVGDFIENVIVHALRGTLDETLAEIPSSFWKDTTGKTFRPRSKLEIEFEREHDSAAARITRIWEGEPQIVAEVLFRKPHAPLIKTDQFSKRIIGDTTLYNLANLLRERGMPVPPEAGA